MSTDLDSAGDERILRYLLGDAQEPDRDEIEERYFHDVTFYDRVIEVEEQLIRRYLEEKIPPADAVLFEQKYFRVPELHQKVTFLRHLRKEARASIANRQDLAAASAPWYRIIRPAFLIPGLATVVVLLGSGVWLVTENAHLLREITQVRSGAQQKTIADQTPVVASPGPVATLTLLPGLTKSISSDTSRRVVWSAALREIRIHFELPGLTEDSPLALELLLVEPQGRRKILTRNGLPTLATTSGRTLTFVAKPEELRPGNYLAFVKRRTTGGDDTLESYSFTVLRP